jgi:hypothetical protein
MSWQALPKELQTIILINSSVSSLDNVVKIASVNRELGFTVLLKQRQHIRECFDQAYSFYDYYWLTNKKYTRESLVVEDMAKVFYEASLRIHVKREDSMKPKMMFEKYASYIHKQILRPLGNTALNQKLQSEMKNGIHFNVKEWLCENAFNVHRPVGLTHK